MSRRGSGVWRPAVGASLLLAAVLAGCVGAPQRAQSPLPPGTAAEPPHGTAAEPPYGTPGNPPFYEVFGRRYHVLPTSQGYQERGIASWYGPDFHGLTTSNGEIYDMHGLTAAHPTLPIPTWVEVTHLGNGRSVTVRINDRGPFVGDRIIDLSYRAARAIDMVEQGTAMVEVRAIEAPTATVAEAPPARPRRVSIAGTAASPAIAERPLQQMFIQVGAFSERTNATRLVEELRAGGYANAFVSSVGAGDGLHRVRIGPVHDEEEFDRVNQGLRALGLADTRLVLGP